MTGSRRIRGIVPAALVIAALSVIASALPAQGGRGGARGPSGPMRQAARLDVQGKTTQARAIYQSVIDTVSDPAAKAAAQRAMAMSYAFDGDCANTVKYESQVIDYWKTREQAEPQNAFYQEGEMADEAARVCIDTGDLDTAEHWYRVGYELGMKEPALRTHPKSLWDFRLAHALGRLAARRGDTTEAHRQIANARRILGSDSAMAAQQRRFLPYLVGYVALYTNDLSTAEAQFTKAIALRGNQRDPFMHCLLAMTYDRMGKQDEAKAMYQKAYAMATAHNPPAAFVRRYVQKKRSAGAVQ
ncbi:MAG TPA: hypothetical protein VFW98_09215 [Gemmatimonadaceae bacterium]|nr:hypothetical protein [Gemmatimonadaceae bacterium]